MKRVLNESTEMVHRHEPQGTQSGTECGATSTVTHDHVRVLPFEQTLDRDDVDRCGRCFGDAGGY